MAASLVQVDAGMMKYTQAWLIMETEAVGNDIITGFLYEAVNVFSFPLGLQTQKSFE